MNRLAPSALMILQARAEARAILFGACEYANLKAATAPLVAYAHASGLTRAIGMAAVRELIAQVFDPVTKLSKNES